MKATTSYLDQLTTNAPRVEITKSNIVDKIYNDITIKNVDFTEVKIQNTTFTDCLFSNCTFTKVDIVNVDIRKCKFINCKFANIKIYYPLVSTDAIKIINSEIIGCNFYKLRCDALLLCESYITDSVFDHITLRYATIQDNTFNRDRIKKLVTCYSQSAQFTDTNVVADGILQTANEKNRNGRSYSSDVVFSQLTDDPKALKLSEIGYLYIFSNTFTDLIMERSEISRLEYKSNTMRDSCINIILDGMPAHILNIINSVFVDSNIYAHILNAETRSNTIINGDIKVYFYNCKCRDQIYNNAKFAASNVELSGYANIKELSTNRCPQEGSFIGYKKVISDPIYRKEYIAVLEIPEDAERSSAFDKKCRCSKAKVIRFEDLEGNTVDIDSAVSMMNSDFKYTINEMVYPDSFDDDWQDECSNGIHFFINKYEAINYPNMIVRQIIIPHIIQHIPMI